MYFEEWYSSVLFFILSWEVYNVFIIKPWVIENWGDGVDFDYFFEGSYFGVDVSTFEC